MRWSIALPQMLDDGTFDPAAFRAYVRRAEELGFEGGWVAEQVLGGGVSIASAMETMTFAAASCDRLRLGCVVFVTPLHQPVHLAKSLSTLDQLSRGRLEIGVGIGGKMRPFGAFGIDADGLVTRFIEGLDVMKALWTQPEVTHRGRFWTLDRATMEPKPFQKPYPRIWFGANAPAAVKRAVEHGGGFFGAGSSTTEAFVEQVKIVREELGAQGRDPAGFPIAKRVYITVADDEAQAKQHMADELIRIYGDFGRRLAPAAVVGPPEVCIEGLRAVADAGAEMILLHSVADQAEQMERLAADVMPAFT